jgi:hypothetical protein
MSEYIVAAARAPRGEPANIQFDLLEKQFHKRSYRYFVVMESSIRMAGADTCETMPRPRIIEVVASRQTLIGFRHRLSSLHNYRPCRNRSRSSFGL